MNHSFLPWFSKKSIEWVFCIVTHLMIAPFFFQFHRNLEDLRVKNLIKKHNHARYILVQNNIFLERGDRKKYLICDNAENIEANLMSSSMAGSKRGTDRG